MRSLLILGLLVVGCQAISDPVPARIINPDDKSRAALKEVVDGALDTSVILSKDALTDTSLLTIERRQKLKLQAEAAQGRNLYRPIQFRLVIMSGECVLIDQRDGSGYALEDTRCEAR